MRERNVVIVDGVRTPFGRMGGILRQYPLSQLAGIAIRGLIEKTEILDRGFVDDVFVGSAMQDAISYNAARYASLYAGLPQETSASYIEMQCGSAINCINMAAWKIMSGNSDVIIAGGAETYSQRAALFSMATEPYKLIPPTAIEQVCSPNEADRTSMIDISDRMARIWNVTREECDMFACRSQQRAALATEKGLFKEEIVPVTVKGGKKQPDYQVFDDEHLRPSTTIEGLAKLCAINPDGVTTAGNASGRNDGAAMVLLMSEERALELGYQPLAYWRAGQDVGVEPSLMGIGPAVSNTKMMKRLGLGLSDIDVIECNEAFAAQNLGVIREMENLLGGTVNQDNWNPLGGAIAFGHPNGASGARICIAAMKELQRRGGKYAIFSSCCGGGLGVSTLIERYPRKG